MANLGTLDMSQNAMDLFNKRMAYNLADNGSETDKLAYLVGNYLGNYFGRARKKKDNEKFDNIIRQAKANPNDPGFVSDENGIRTTNAPQLSNQDYNYIINGSMNGGDPVISSGVDAQELLTRPAADYGKFEQAKPVQQAFNPNYNEQYLRNEARKQGIASSVVNQRMAETRADIAQTANAMLLPEIQKNLYGYTDENGNRVAPTIDSQLKAMAQLDKLAQYSPDTAKTYQALALQGLQGDVNFARQKELAQIKANDAVARANQNLQNRIAYRQATAGLTNNAKNNRNGYDPTKVANAGKRIQEIDQFVADGGKLTDALRQEYNTHRKYLESVGDGNTSNMGNKQLETPQRVTEKTPQKEQSIADTVRGIFNNIDFGNYDNADEIADGKKYNFAQGTQAAVDAMRNAGANDDQIFKAVDKLLGKQESAGNLPEGYRESFAHSMGRKTDKELVDEAIKRKEQEALQLDMKLNPQKYGIDPMEGVKYTFDAIANGKPLWNLAGNYNK